MRERCIGAIKRCRERPHATPGDGVKISELSSARSDTLTLGIKSLSQCVMTPLRCNAVCRNMFVLWKYCSRLGFQFQILINCKLGMDGGVPTWGWGQLGKFWIKHNRRNGAQIKQMDDIFKSYLITFSCLNCQPIVPTKIKISAASVQFSKIAGNGWGWHVAW